MIELSEWKKIKNVVGLRFGMVTVLRDLGNNERQERIVEYKCDCGKVSKTWKAKLRKMESCGCKRLSEMHLHARKHGQSYNKVFKRWQHMMQRCYHPQNPSYHRYGGRGIFVEESWHDFQNFLKDMQETYKTGLQIDRIDNDGPYSRDNCRWVTPKQNANNTSRNVFIELNGVTKTVSQWCDEYKVSRGTVYGRIKRGWDKERLFEKSQTGVR